MEKRRMHLKDKASPELSIDFILIRILFFSRTIIVAKVVPVAEIALLPALGGHVFAMRGAALAEHCGKNWEIKNELYCKHFSIHAEVKQRMAVLYTFNIYI